MTKNELTMAWHLANDPSFISDPDTSLTWALGFGLEDFRPRHISVEALATLIRYQCRCLDMSWDMEAFDEIARHGKNKFLVHV